ncbi:MAG TPA: sigma 54-interacting transcriptional regulator [Desulfitobacterium dehalogenans]|uniref:Sigma 54-interacting transcriptional regulator n=1 Tax=Desulfitobacterium dehalogenans TaxID=36854 RepID=A0A7C7DC07_9FIRM|nr:sigma 54-interacting transcriptional regulator [Desulfitobacterium dehalogenans]
MNAHELFQRISQGTEKAYLEKCRDQRELFMKGKPVDQRIVPKGVYNSWVRSQQYGVNPFEKPCHHPIDKSRSNDLNRLIECLERYHFFIKHAIELIDYEGFTFSFAAREGFTKQIHDNIGSPFANLIGECSERTVGTTTTALALAENRPVALVSPLNYQDRPYIEGVGVAAPIHDPQGEVLGAIAIGLRDCERAQEAYWMVTYLAQVFDRLYLPITQQHEKKIKDIIDLLPQGVAYVNHKKSVHYNEKFQTLVNLSKGKNPLKKLSEFFSQEDWDSASAPQEIKVDGKTFILNSSILDEGKIVKSKVITLEEKQLLPHRLGENGQGLKATDGLYSFEDIVGNSAELNEAKSTGLNVAGTSVPVLIFGENGTGKEMFAQAIHAASPRREKPFIAINCGAIPAELVESELFGYEEGSFTGALKGGKVGKIEAASGGTLFLDEIESMPVQDQIKLLRVLSTGKVQKVGSTKETPVDIRLISATKKDLLEESDKGLFREDLYFRISTFIIELPALRQRREDILLLTKEFIEKFSRKYSLRQTIEMDQEFVDALENYSWRGNVRELEHSIERAIILMGAGTTLKVDYLSKRIQESYQNYQVRGLVEDVLTKGLKKQEQGLLYTAEAIIIDHVLKSVGGNVTAAAEKLGVTRKTIYNKLQEHPDLRAVK